MRKFLGEILFISHDASGTGAPYILLLLLGWLKKNTSIRFRVVLATGGQRENAFRSIAPTYNVSTGDGWVKRFILKLSLGISWRLYRKLSFMFFKRYINNYEISLIYSNTITNGTILSKIVDKNVPVISHVHELRSVFEQSKKEGGLTQALKHTNRFIAVSDSVKENLVQNYGVDYSLIDVIRGFIDLDCAAKVVAASVAAKVRKIVGGEPADYLFVACGSLCARKGPDLFLKAAHSFILHPESQSAHFVWVGGQSNSHEYNKIVNDTIRLGIQDRVHFVGYRNDYLDFLAAADVFLLTSREDPFPLVALEAAALEKPIICFADAGGTPEFVRKDAGICVPFEDIDSMRDAILALTRSAEDRLDLGKTAKLRVQESHSINVGASKIYRIIIELLLREIPTEIIKR